MGSIIGQAMQGAGPSLSAIGSSLGSLFGAGASAVPQAAEAATSTPGGYGSLPSSVPTVVPSDTTDIYGWPGMAGIGYSAPTGDTSSLTGAPIDPNSPDAIMSGAGGDSSGGMMAAPAPSYFPPGPTSPLNAGAPAPGTTNALTGAPAQTPEQVMGMTQGDIANQAADPASWWQSFQNSAFGQWLLGDTKAKGALGSPLSVLGTAGGLADAIARWQTAQTLRSPSALASGASGLYQPMSAAMKRAITAPVTAAAQETGQINAPGLYAQSVASALAPYQYQMQMNALREYIAALQASGSAYPTGGLFGPAGLVPPTTSGGPGTSASASQ